MTLLHYVMGIIQHLSDLIWLIICKANTRTYIDEHNQNVTKEEIFIYRMCLLKNKIPLICAGIRQYPPALSLGIGLKYGSLYERTSYF